MPIMRRQLSTAVRTVNPGRRLLSEEGLVMIVFADAGFKHRWQAPAASDLTPPPPPSMRSPSH